MTHVYCTYFDANYVARGLALHESLRRVAEPFTLWILSFDEEAASALDRLAFPDVRVVRLDELERADPEFAATRSGRSRVEYYFTSTPVWTRYVLDENPNASAVIYVDADLWFFGDVTPLGREMEDASVGIIEHRFPPRLRQLEMNGRFNVGWVFFRNDQAARACLGWWRDRCIEWCYDRVEHDRFADQKYLDTWPTRFERVRVVRHPGANVAPWNLATHDIGRSGDRVVVDGEPLIFFHFHGLRRTSAHVLDPQISRYGTRLSRTVRQHVYAPYLASVERGEAMVGIDLSARYATVRAGPGTHGTGVRAAVARARLAVRRVLDIVVPGRRIVLVRGRVR